MRSILRAEGHNAVHVHINLANVGADRRGDRDRRRVRPAAPERRDVPFGVGALKARHHRDLPGLHGLEQLRIVDVLDARLRERAIRLDPHLMPEQTPRPPAERLNRHRDEASIARASGTSDTW
jgi:hypothetical protein